MTDPAIVPVGRATLVLRLSDRTGKPILNAKVSAMTQMPGMPMGEREQVGVPEGDPGTYRVPASFGMAGSYQTKISVSGALGSAYTTLALQTGESTAGGTGFNWTAGLWLLGLAAIVAFVAHRMRKTGQRIRVRKLLTAPVITALILLGLVLAFSVFVVNHFRRPGSMTPIEAQVMDMSVPAPEGVIPVTLATAQRRPFKSAISFAGQVVGYETQDVSPRVTGTILSMPFYAGDHVHKGQVLIRLDSSQSRPQVSEKTDSLRGAQSAVASAEADYEQAQAAVREAQAEHGQMEGLIQESVANSYTARDAEEAAKAQIAGANADLATAQAGVAAAQADRTYWTSELKRIQELYADGVLSLNQLQRETADAQRSAATLAQAQQAVVGAQAKLRTAEAQEREAASAADAADKRVLEAHSELSAHHAHVQTAIAAANSAHQKIAMAVAGTGTARAELESAQANLDYSVIRAEADGVVAERLISPGVLVNPGQTILRIVQIRPIRIQAIVPEGDLDRIKIGAEVTIRPSGSTSDPVVSRVASIWPALDSSTHTGIVEAQVSNDEGSFLPGQFVSMDIATSSSRDSLVVPSAAIRTESESDDSNELSTDEKHYVWVASANAGRAGEQTIDRLNVTVGESSDGWTEIRRGLTEGAQVVSSPAAELRPGQRIAAANPSESAASPSITVRITENGFEPPYIDVTPGQEITITFIRTTENTCAKEVTFPALNITRQLPLNEPVEIRLPARPAGDLSFVCGMQMLSGRVSVR